MARIAREEYIRYMAKSLDLPPGVIEKIVAPRREGDDKDGGWRIARMVTLVDLQPYGLGERLTSSGWRTILSSIVED